jgi:hypothetical protein
MTTPCVEAWLVGPCSTNFYTRTYSPPTKPIAVLVFVHGAAEHSGRYTDMHTALCAEHGIAVFAYDQRGFGRTALDVPNRTEGSAYGKTKWGDEMGDLDWAVRTAHGEFPDAPVFLMGTSMVFRRQFFLEFSVLVNSHDPSGWRNSSRLLGSLKSSRRCRVIDFWRRRRQPMRKAHQGPSQSRHVDRAPNTASSSIPDVPCSKQPGRANMCYALRLLLTILLGAIPEQGDQRKL